jgi:hypothetical protein
MVPIGNWILLRARTYSGYGFRKGVAGSPVRCYRLSIWAKIIYAPLAARNLDLIANRHGTRLSASAVPALGVTVPQKALSAT